MKFNPGKTLYAMYRELPPDHGGASHREAYFHGWNGTAAIRRYVKGSIAWWAYKAGADNRKSGLRLPK